MVTGGEANIEIEFLTEGRPNLKSEFWSIVGDYILEKAVIIQTIELFVSQSMIYTGCASLAREAPG